MTHHNDSGTGQLLVAALVAMAIGAGAALLYAPEEGTRTRRKVRGRFDRLQRDVRRSRAGELVKEQIAELQNRIARGERRRRRDRRAAALLGLVVGAGATVLLTPESGPVARERLGRGARELGRRAGAQLDAVRRGEVRDGLQSSARPDRPVRSIQELGRDPEDVM